jgi:hypothetical protein
MIGKQSSLVSKAFWYENRSAKTTKWAYLDKYLLAELSYRWLPVLFEESSDSLFFSLLHGFRAFACLLLKQHLNCSPIVRL